MFLKIQGGDIRRAEEEVVDTRRRIVFNTELVFFRRLKASVE
jgi:hypothetical protein